MFDGNEEGKGGRNLKAAGEGEARGDKTSVKKNVSCSNP